MQTKTLQEIVTEITNYPAEAETRTVTVADCKVGSCPAHQGDVYVHRVADNHPRGGPLGTNQVAVGDTIGSRHVAVGSQLQVFKGQQLPSYFRKPKWAVDNGLSDEAVRAIFLGPVVVAGETWCLEHPEHAHHTMPPGTYQVTYQADARSRERVRD